MKRLLRLFLFTFTRLGCFLGILGWVAGQWWWLDLDLNTGSSFGEVNVMVTSPGIVFQRCPSNQPAGINCSLGDAPAKPYELGWLLTNGENVYWYTHSPVHSYIQPRRTAAEPLSARMMFVSIHHWLVVVAFIVLYLILKCVYRVRAGDL